MLRTRFQFTLPLFFAVTTTVAFLGCDKGDPSGTADDKGSSSKNADGKNNTSAEAKDLASLFAGKKPTVPAPFETLMPGMSAEEATKAMPSMAKKGRWRLPEYDGLSFSAYIPKRKPRLQHVQISFPKGVALPLATAAWGEPVISEDKVLKRTIPTWFNPETGLRAKLEDGFGDDQNLVFDKYLAYADFLGAEGPTFAFEKAQPLMGATLEQLRAGYPNEIEEKSAADAKKDRENLKKMVGKKNEKKLAILGNPEPSVQLNFPTTEFGKYTTPVHLTFKEGKVTRYWFSVDFEMNMGAKETIKAFITKKMGEGKEGKDIVGKPVVLWGKGPYVLLKEDTISHGWDFSVDGRKPRLKK